MHSAEILLFPVAHTGLRERIRVRTAEGFSCSSGEQERRTRGHALGIGVEQASLFWGIFLLRRREGRREHP